MSSVISEEQQPVRAKIDQASERLTELEREAAQQLVERLVDYRERIRILIPDNMLQHSTTTAFALFAMQAT